MKLKSFAIRTLSGAVLLLLLCSALIISGGYLLLLLGFISVVGMVEIFKGTKNKDVKIMEIITIIMAVILYLGFAFIDLSAVFRFLILVLVSLLMLLMSIFVFSFPKYAFEDISKNIFAFVYLPLMLSFVYITRTMEWGQYLVWLIPISSWGCDTCAYLVGSAFGKHKLAPVLSPKKSVEGAIGGIAGAAVLALIFSMIVTANTGSDQKLIWMMPVIACFCAAFSQVGDLCASAIKRQYNIKDFGSLIPGHGGILDRFDSMIVIAPVIYIVGVFLI